MTGWLPDHAVVLTGWLRTDDSHLTITLVNNGSLISELTRTSGGLRWACSRVVIEQTEALVGALCDGNAEHQFVDVSGRLRPKR